MKDWPLMWFSVTQDSILAIAHSRISEQTQLTS